MEYSLKELPSNFKQTELESKIINARCSSVAISDLPPKKLKENIESMISSSVAIYGFYPPTSEGMIDLLTSEMTCYFLNNGFCHLTYDEFHLALQLNARGNLKFPSGVDAEPVKTFGATVSVKFVSDVLCLYMKFRDLLDRKIQNHIDGY